MAVDACVQRPSRRKAVPLAHRPAGARGAQWAGAGRVWDDLVVMDFADRGGVLSPLTVLTNPDVAVVTRFTGVMLGLRVTER